MKMQIPIFRVLCPDVLRYTVDILHQFHRMLERIGIDSLHKI